MALLKTTVLLMAALTLRAAAVGSLVASPLRAGVAVVDITPPAGETLEGYQSPRFIERVHDPLFARVLVLRTEDLSLALVTSDLYRLHSATLVDRVRRELGIAHTILCSSHNHSAPSIEPGRYSPWRREAEEKIFKAVQQAQGNLFSALISWGEGSLIGGHNIRIIREDGTVQERWSNPEEEGTAPIDPAVKVIRVDQEGKGARALLVHYSCDPAILGSESREISADFPGALARTVEKEFGKSTICLFAAGAAANVYPFRSHLSGTAAYEEVERMGQRLGREVVRVARTLQQLDADSELKARESRLSFSNRWLAGQRFEVGISTVLINRSLALVAVPAEMFVEFQITLSRKSPAAMTLLLGSSYSSGGSWAGTVPTIMAAAEGGFGASYATDIEAGAGEALVDHGVIDVAFLLGRLSDLPKGELTRKIPDLPSP